MAMSNTPANGAAPRDRARGWFGRVAAKLGLAHRAEYTMEHSPALGPGTSSRDGSSETLKSSASLGHLEDVAQVLILETEVQDLRNYNEELLQQVRSLQETHLQAPDEDSPSYLPSPEGTVGRLKSDNDILEERFRLLQTELSELRAASALLQGELTTLRFTEEKHSKKLETTELQLESARQLLATSRENNKALQSKLADTREKLTDSRQKVVDSLKLTRERLVTTTALWAEARKYFALFRQGLLADEMAKTDISFAADTYVSLLPSTVPAALDLQRRYGGRVVCDCVENVEVEKHSLAPKMHAPALEMVNLNAYGALGVVDGLMTVSHAVARTLRRYGPPVRVQPNYRRRENPVPSGNLREMFQLEADSRVLITSGNIVKGFEAVIDAFHLLPENVHLVALAKFSPPEYDLNIRTYLSQSGLQHRIHLHEFVPYDELSSLLADADAGVITLDPGNPNHSVSLPNRVFDFTTSGLPFVVPKLTEIEAFVNRYGVGVAINDVTPQDWASGIEQLLADLTVYKRAVRAARDDVTWESLDEGLIKFLGNPKSVTLLGFRDLSRYQRFLRMTDSLTQRGIEVKAVFFSENPAPIKNPAAKFYHFSDRYGRGPGLIEVPHAGESSSDLVTGLK